MAFTEEVMDSMNRLNNFQSIQASIRARAYVSAVPYFAFSRAAMMVQDMFMKKLQADNIGAIQSNIPLMLGSNFGVATDLIGKEGADAVVVLRKALETDYKGLYENWKAGIYHGVGGAYSSAMEQFLGTGDLLWAYKHLMHRIAVTPKMARHWMKTFRPTVPSTGLGYTLLNRGLIDLKRWEELARYEGWPEKDIKLIRQALEARPSPHTAFRLYARGHISKADYLKHAEAAGYVSPYGDLISKQWEWWPNAREAFYMQRRGLLTVKEREKHYKGQGYTPEIRKKLTAAFEKWPSSQTAYKMLVRGQITGPEFARYCDGEGWPVGFEKKIAGIYQWWPTAHEAFYMWKKGIINQSMRNMFYKGQGYPTWLHDKMTANFEYVPTLYDLIRIADYQELDLIWATRIMVERGMKTKDIAKFLEYLKYRPLREEVRDLTRQLVWRYQFGRIAPVEFETELGKLPIGVTEKTLITDYAEMKYEDELITEQVFILKWQFRMGWITEANYLAGLISLGFREEKANLMVEQEKAQGYFGYY